MRRFTCRSCSKQSRFLRQKKKNEFFIEFKVGLSSQDDETRSYDCEFCNVENQITQPRAAWVVVDSGT
jgi:hypothetical protein